MSEKISLDSSVSGAVLFCATFQQSPLSKITLAGTYRDRHKERRYQAGHIGTMQRRRRAYS